MLIGACYLETNKGSFILSLPEEHILELLLIAFNSFYEIWPITKSTVIRRQAYAYFEGLDKVLVHLRNLMVP